ncbi:hypothetical protein GCM10023340_38940 [Nocardioides marinquilinus]|uniref:Phage tail tape measure protein domain-containing protein n=1 Tax=Nocardioides marinquilinus TaxID=1210400 RepID=A0ABP9PZE8_9ACTN
MPDPEITIRGNADLGPVSVGLRQVVAGAGKMAAGVGAAAAAATAALTKEFGEQEKLTDRLAAALGSNAKEQGRLGKLAGSLYADAYGEEMGDVVSAIDAVRSSFRELGTGAELKKVTEQALNFAGIFEIDVPRAVSVAQTVVKAGLAKDATEALDLLTASAQKVPAALRENILDAADEYGQFFSSIGYDGEQAFSALVRGAKQGEFGIDKIGDAVKEFTVLSTDMSTGSTAAYKTIGVDAQKAADDVLAGGKRARGATDRILEGLLKLPPGAEQANAAIALFGTPLEDLNVTKIPDFLRALQDGQKGLGKFEGAIDRAGDTLNDNASSRLTSFKREIQQTFVNVVGGKVLPIVDELVEQLRQDYRSGGLEGAIGGLADQLERATGVDIGPLLDDAEDGLDSVVRIAEKLGPAFLDAADGLSPLLSPLGLAVDGLELLADIVEAIPDDVASLAFQAGVFLAVLPRLRGAVVGVSGAMATARVNATGYWQALRYGSQHSQNAALAMGKLKAAAGTAAGVGGLLALSSGLGETDTAAGKLQTSLGAAGLGFALGGLPGLIVGGVVGALISFKDEIGNVVDDIPILGDAFDRVGDAFGAIKNEIDPTLRLTEEFKNVVEAATPSVGAYADSLDQVSGATTRATRSAILLQAQEKGVLTESARLGISTRDLVGAVLGQEGAVKRVTAAYGNAVTVSGRFGNVDGKIIELTGQGTRQFAEKRRKLEELGFQLIDTSREEAKAAGSVRAFLGAQQKSIRADGEKVREQQRVNQEIGKLRGLISKKLVQKYDSEGLPVTERGLARLVSQQKEFQKRKTLKALIAASGVDTTVKSLRRIVDGLDEVDKKPAKLTEFKSTFERHIGDFRQEAERGGRDVAARLTDGSRRAKFDGGPLNSSLRSGTGAARGIAYSGGVGVGDQLEAGIISGFATAQYRLSSQAAAAVRGAIASARNAGKIQSPSKETEYLGRMLGEGFGVGLDKSTPGVSAKASGLVSQITKALGGVTGGSEGISGAIEKLGNLIESTYEARERAAERTAAAELKAEKARLRERLKGEKLEKALRAAENESERALRKRTKAIREAGAAAAATLREESRLLKANGKQQDANAAKLARATDQLKQARDEYKSYAAAIKESFVSYGSVIGLGQLEDGSVSIGSLLDQLEDRAERAKRFAALIASFRDKQGPKLSETAIQQLLDQGPEAALATAEAIAAGGASAINDINALQAQIAAAGGGLGQTMAKEFKQAGIQAAAGLVAGLEREQRRLDRVAIRIGDRLAQAIRKALGIKSPSRVFRSVGEQTMAGLAIGLDDTRVQKIMRKTAADMTAPFGRNDFAPRLGYGASGAGVGTLTVIVRPDAAAIAGLRAGKEFSVQVDAAHLVGVRKLAIGGA